MAARNPNFTTQFQEFMKESFEKESSQRLAWFNKRRSHSMNRPRQLEVFRKKITEGSKPSEALLEKLPAIGVEPRHNRKKADFNDPLLGNRARTSVDLQMEMRPPSPETRNALFDGFTKEGKGRYQYLRKRYDTIPEKKFTFPILSSWEYGWRLEDVIKKEDIKKPPHGRTRIVSDTFYTRNGIGIAPESLKSAWMVMWNYSIFLYVYIYTPERVNYCDSRELSPFKTNFSWLRVRPSCEGCGLLLLRLIFISSVWGTVLWLQQKTKNKKAKTVKS